jgi:hypothetical protein
VLAYVDQSPIVLKQVLPHFIVIELQGFRAAPFKLFNEISFQEKGAGSLVNNALEAFTAEQHFIAVGSRNFGRAVFLAKIGYAGKAVTVQAYDTVVFFPRAYGS